MPGDEKVSVAPFHASYFSNIAYQIMLELSNSLFSSRGVSLQTKETFAEVKVKGADDTNERVHGDEDAGEDIGAAEGKTREETTIIMDSHDRATIGTDGGNTMLVGGAAGDGEEGSNEDIAQSEFAMGSLMSEKESADKKPANVKGFEDNVGGILGRESDVGGADAGADAIPAEGGNSDRSGIVDDVSTEHEASVVVVSFTFSALVIIVKFNCSCYLDILCF